MTIIRGSIGVTHRPASWKVNLDAWIIQIGTQSRYNHTGIVTDVVYNSRTGRPDTVQVIEAAGGGVRKRWLPVGSKAAAEWVFEDSHRITPEQREILASEAEKFMGWPYDYSDIAWFVWRFLSGKVRRRPAKVQADEKVICSELVSWSMFAAGISPWPEVQFGDISPGDIADWIFRQESERL